MTEIILKGLIFFLSGFVQGLTGFAFALLAVPLLSLLGSLRASVGQMATVGMIIILYSYYLHRKEACVKRVLPLAFCAIASMPLGAVFLVYTPERYATIALGVVLILLVVSTRFWNARSTDFIKSKTAGYIFAGISGLLGGAFSAPGPIIVAYFTNSEFHPLQAKANTQLFFAFTSVALFFTHLFSGTITRNIILGSISLIPLSLGGTYLGVYISRGLSSKILKTLIEVSLIVIALYLILTRL
ncbi:MAG: sulfite exporter TauE/SafE family protein [Spirochaetales bacterium]